MRIQSNGRAKVMRNLFWLLALLIPSLSTLRADDTVPETNPTAIIEQTAAVAPKTVIGAVQPGAVAPEVVPTVSEPINIAFDQLQAEFQNLEQMERALVDAQKQLVNDGMDSESLVGRISEKLSQVPEADRALLTISDSKGRTKVPKDSVLASLAEELKTGIKPMEAFQEQYDAFNLAKIDFFMKRTMYIAQQLVMDAEAAGESPVKLEKLKALRTTLSDNYREYKKQEPNFGTTRDRPRRFAARQFLASRLSFMNTAAEGKRTNGERVMGVIKPIMAKLTSMRQFGALLPAAPALVANVQDKPIGLRSKSAVKAMMGAYGLTHKLTGEALPGQLPDNTVVLYAGMHANKLLDLASMVELSTPDSQIITNAGRAIPDDAVPGWGKKLTAGLNIAKAWMKGEKLPKPLKDDAMVADPIQHFMKTVNDITVVGGDENPLGEVFTRVEQGKNKIIILPEGNLGVTFAHEVRPAVKSWAGGFVRAMRAAGKQVVVYPVTFPYHYQLGTYWGSTDSPWDIKQLVTHVNKPIPAHVVDLAFVANDASIVSTLTRQAWFDTMANDTHPQARTRAVGMLPVRTLNMAGDLQIADAVNCKNVLKAVRETAGALDQ